MEKLLFLSLVILMPCVMIVTEAGFFGDYGILEQNIQSIGFGGDNMAHTSNHGRLRQTSNFDLYGPSFDNSRLGEMSIGSGIRGGGGHRGGRHRGGGGKRNGNGNDNGHSGTDDKKKPSKESSKESEDVKDSNVVSFEGEKLKMKQEKIIKYLNGNFEKWVPASRRASDYTYQICKECGGARLKFVGDKNRHYAGKPTPPKKESKPQSGDKEGKSKETCLDCIDLDMFDRH